MKIPATIDPLRAANSNLENENCFGLSVMKFSILKLLGALILKDKIEMKSEQQQLFTAATQTLYMYNR